MLKAVGLTVGYGSEPVVSDIDASLQEGGLTVLIGANGSGKSTLLRTLSGAQPPLGGEVLLEGMPVSKISATRLARLLAIVLTDRAGAGGLTVAELVAIGRHPYSGFLGSLSSDDREIIINSLEAVGLASKSHRYIGELSDGERQKAMIARALAQDTEIIILDEPTSFLDVASRFEIMSLLRNLAENYNKAVLLSSHDTAASIPLAHRIWAVENGRLHDGNVTSLASQGILDKVFEGAEFDLSVCDFRPVGQFRQP